MNKNTRRFIKLERLIFILILFISVPSLYSHNISQEIPEQDSTVTFESLDSAIIVEDEDESVIDSTSEDEKNFTLDAGLAYKNSSVKNGIDVSSGKAVQDISIGLSHLTGFSIDFSKTKILGVKNIQDSWIAGLSYNYSINDWMDIGAGYSRYKYNDQTENALVGTTNSMTISTDFIFFPYIIDLSYDYYFGDDKLSYLTLAGFGMFELWELKILPMASISFSSYNVDVKRLNLKEKKIETGKVKKKELGAVSLSLKLGYQIISSLEIYTYPAVYFSPDKNINSKDFQFNISLGLGYSLDFW